MTNKCFIRNGRYCSRLDFIGQVGQTGSLDLHDTIVSGHTIISPRVGNNCEVLVSLLKEDAAGFVVPASLLVMLQMTGLCICVLIIFVRNARLF